MKNGTHPPCNGIVSCDGEHCQLLETVAVTTSRGSAQGFACPPARQRKPGAFAQAQVTHSIHLCQRESLELAQPLPSAGMGLGAALLAGDLGRLHLSRGLILQGMTAAGSFCSFLP